MKKIIFLILVSVCLVGCEKIALFFTAKKKPIASESKLATKAENDFWNTLHRGKYQDIDQTNRLLLAAYLQNPNDPKLAAHLAFLHIWKITERHRLKTIEPMIVNEIILAKHFFQDAVTLDANDARYLGFLGDSLLVTGQIFNDRREEIKGYFTLKKAISQWPQFNYFTAGFPMSSLAADSSQFKEGLEWQWKTLDLCAHEKVNRDDPNYSRYMKLETHEGPDRACWNSWIAPHNFEGFFLNMGDMLVKSGDPKKAIKIYNNAKLSKDYSTWPFKSILEEKIKLAEENVTHFQKEYISPTKSIMFNAGYGCVACHQK